MRKSTRFLAFILAICGIFCCLSFASAAEVYHHAQADCSKKIALTFDDGPHPKLTQQILAILEEYHVRATFFMIGENVDLYPEAAKAVADAGHEIGNHTYSHAHLSRLNEDSLRSELKKCEESIESVCGQKPTLFRPPEGAIPSFVLKCADEFSYSVILWSVDTRDWENKNTGKITNSVLSGVKSGDLILMHDYIGRGSKTPESLRILIPKLLAQGYEFVTVSELLGLA